MAKTAAVSEADSNFALGRNHSDHVKMKRKTPSQLRGEQLKRRNAEISLTADPQLTALLVSEKINLGSANVPKKTELKIPKYINTRVDKVYPVKKSSERCRLLHGKERNNSIFIRESNDVIDSFVASNIPPKGKSPLQCNISECSQSSAKESTGQGFRKIEKCSESALRNVVELHLGDEKYSDSGKVDMQKALRGLGARDVSGTSASWDDSLRKYSDQPSISSGRFCSEFRISGHKSPLDFTLKTALRLVSSSSVKWCHKLSATPAPVGHLTLQFGCNNEQKVACPDGSNMETDALYTKALHSWVYPQSSLPASIISVMALSTAKGEKDFLLRRQQDWEDSFRNLYYMLRKNICNIFYVYTTQFVVLFIGGNFSGKKHSCNAYISKSTRGLRSLLKKHDIQFSMPFCCVEVEQAAEDDLVELSEIEKHNLGQTVHMDAISDADNTPQSVLAFIGNESAHGLYDFLLNYRFFLNSFTGVDVPMLYAPAPFQNASLSVPEVQCKEIKRADGVLPCSSGSDEESTEASRSTFGTSICYSIEIKDTIVPPWIVSGLCAAMSLDGRSFESSFTSEPSSISLNNALDSICQKSDPSTESNSSLPIDGDTLGIPQTVLSPYLRSASLSRLKYENGSYMAYVNPGITQFFTGSNFVCA